jgi:hypothetical protein
VAIHLVRHRFRTLFDAFGDGHAITIFAMQLHLESALDHEKQLILILMVMQVNVPASCANSIFDSFTSPRSLATSIRKTLANAASTLTLLGTKPKLPRFVNESATTVYAERNEETSFDFIDIGMLGRVGTSGRE